MTVTGGLPQTERGCGCAPATLYVNRSVESKLTEKLDATVDGDNVITSVIA